MSQQQPSQGHFYTKQQQQPVKNPRAAAGGPAWFYDLEEEQHQHQENDLLIEEEAAAPVVVRHQHQHQHQQQQQQQQQQGRLPVAPEDEENVTTISHEDDDDDSTASSCAEVDPETVIERIENWIVVQAVLEPLDAFECPSVKGSCKTFFHATHCRNLTSLCLVASFCHDLLQARRTTTCREVYYYFVTHFRNQGECDKTIWDLAVLLKTTRSSLGLAASPKGWCCGCLTLFASGVGLAAHGNSTTGNHGAAAGDLIWNGRELDVHGMTITTTYIKQQVVIQSDAKCILVIEKEGVYNRLSEDKFFLHYYPCILVTGKGFPDVATRQWVQHLQQVLQLPVYGLCDCNPYGISVLDTYQYSQVVTSKQKQKNQPRRQRLNLQWMGLRPSQLDDLELPPSVFQQQTDLDQKRIESLLKETHPFCQQGPQRQQRLQELQELQEQQYKVELEALNWKGMDFMCQWVHSILVQHEQAIAESGESEYII